MYVQTRKQREEYLKQQLAQIAKGKRCVITTKVLRGAYKNKKSAENYIKRINEGDGFIKRIPS